MLETLERANLFVVPLDDKRGWYRYHQLFADVFQARSKEEQPERVLGLHRHASEWLARNGQPTKRSTTLLPRVDEWRPRSGPILVYGSRSFRDGLTWASTPELRRWWLALSKAVGAAPPRAPVALAEAALCVLVATLRQPALE